MVLKIQRWGEHPGLPGWAHHEGPYGREAGGDGQSEKPCEDRVGTCSHKPGDTGSLLKLKMPVEGSQPRPAPHPDLTSASRTQESPFFKPPKVWKFVTKTQRMNSLGVLSHQTAGCPPETVVTSRGPWSHLQVPLQPWPRKVSAPGRSVLQGAETQICWRLHILPFL